MKTSRQTKILELIQKYQIETQEELQEYLHKEGYPVTQATVSRDIRQMKLMKVSTENGKHKYSAMVETDEKMTEKYVRVLRDGFLSMDMAQNILVIKTVSGMAGAVCAAIDAMQFHEIVGSIAGDDTIMCAVRTVEETDMLMKKLRKVI